MIGTKPDVATFTASIPWSYRPSAEEFARLNEITELTDAGYVGISAIVAALKIEYCEAQDRLCEWVAAGRGDWVQGREGIAARDQADAFGYGNY